VPATDTQHSWWLRASEKVGGFQEWVQSLGNLRQLSLPEMNCLAVQTGLGTIGHSHPEKHFRKGGLLSRCGERGAVFQLMKRSVTWFDGRRPKWQQRSASFDCWGTIPDFLGGGCAARRSFPTLFSENPLRRFPIAIQDGPFKCPNSVACNLLHAFVLVCRNIIWKWHVARWVTMRGLLSRSDTC
jgi:hypothetical protein